MSKTKKKKEIPENFKIFSWVIIENIMSVLVQLISTIVLARILSPFDFGIIGMITIFIALSNIIVDSGMGGALIRKKNVLDEDYSTLFIYNIALSLTIYVILFSTSNTISSFYGIEELSRIIKVLTLVVVINSLTIVQSVNLIKNLKFKKIAISSIIASLCSFLLALEAAQYGYGVWSLVAQQISFSIIRGILLLYFNRYMPKPVFSISSFKEQFSFGINLLGSNLLNVVYNNLSSSIIGKINTPIQAGFFSQASKFSSIPINISTSVIDKAVYPILTRTANVKVLFDIYKKYLKAIVITIVPIIFLVSFSGKDMLMILLGAKWLTSGDIFRILIFLGICAPIIYLNRCLFKALGKTKTILIIDVINFVIGISALLISVQYQLTLTAWALVFVSLFNLLLQLFVISRIYNETIWLLVREFVIVIFISVILLVILNLIDRILLMNEWHRIIISFLIALLFLLTSIRKNIKLFSQNEK